MIQDNITGAPFNIGDKVRVIGANLDDSFDQEEIEYFGATEITGIVTGFDYNTGCGESYPHDPCIHVSGTGAWFWKEELELIVE